MRVVLPLSFRDRCDHARAGEVVVNQAFDLGAATPKERQRLDANYVHVPIVTRTVETSKYDLGLRDGTIDARTAYVFVHAQDYPIYTIVGWIFGREVPERGHKFTPSTGNPNTIWFVKKDKLHAPALLIDWIRPRGESLEFVDMSKEPWENISHGTTRPAGR